MGKFLSPIRANLSFYHTAPDIGRRKTEDAGAGSMKREARQKDVAGVSVILTERRIEDKMVLR